VVATHRRALGGESWTSDVEWNDRVLKVHVEPLRRGDEVGGVVSVALDVTDRNRATAVLNEMEQRLRTQYEGFPIPTYTWQRVGDDFLLVGFNEAAERASEGAARRYVGRKATEIYREEPEILRDITRSATEQTTIQREMRYSVPEIDRETFLRVTYVFVPPDQVVVHTEDQTRRRELEEELLVTEESLRTLVDRSSDAIFIIDPSQDVILDANARAGEMLGYEREQLLSIRPSDLHPEEMPQLLRFMEALETGRSGWTDDFTCTTRDGRLLRVEIAAARAPFRGHRAVINLIRPITPGREADPTLLEALSPAGGHG
jgi:PAS domain S-box-containing protein